MSTHFLGFRFFVLLGLVISMHWPSSTDAAELNPAYMGPERPMWRSLESGIQPNQYHINCEQSWDDFVKAHKALKWEGPTQDSVGDYAWSYYYGSSNNDDPKVIAARKTDLSKAKDELKKGISHLLSQGLILPDDLTIYLGVETNFESKPGHYKQMATLAYQRGPNCEPRSVIMLNFMNKDDLYGIANRKVSGHSRISMTIIHEIGHILHDRFAGRFFWERSLTGRNALPNGSPKPGMAINVSKYAAEKNNLEFVAEAFTASALGLSSSYQNDVWSHYIKLHGPPLNKKEEARLAKIFAKSPDAIVPNLPIRISGPDSPNGLPSLNSQLLFAAENVIDDFFDIQKSEEILSRMRSALNKRTNESASASQSKKAIAEQFLTDSMNILDTEQQDARVSRIKSNLEIAISSLFDHTDHKS